MLRMKGVLGVYVGWERDCEEPKVFSKTFFRELAPPFRYGTGRRVRFGTQAFQIGRYKVNKEATETIDQLGGRALPQFTPEEIGRWNGQGVRTQEEPDPAA